MGRREPIDQDDVSGDGEEEDEEEFTPEGDRDYVMARLAAVDAGARGALDAARAAVDAFVAPEDDASGKIRVQAMEAADVFLGEAAAAPG